MSVTYKITFTPSGPYFFGNEKTFWSRGESDQGVNANRYFIKGEKTPSQSTLFGAVRYLLLAPGEQRTLVGAKRAADIVGKESFRLDSTSVQTFGVLERMSAMMITDGKDLLIPTPFDHKKKAETYTPFCQYHPYGKDDARVYTKEYDAKLGLADDYMRIGDGTIASDLFRTEVRVGIARNKRKDAFFKKAFWHLKQGYSFVVYVEIADDNRWSESRQDVVFLGQGKVPFSVCISRVSETVKAVYDQIATCLTKNRHAGSRWAYCLSDCCASTGMNMNDLYHDVRFAAAATRDFRSFDTNSGRISTKLYRLIKAGSMFMIPDNWDKMQNENAEKIGLNQIIYVKENDKK